MGSHNVHELDPHGIDQHTQGAKLDAGKPRVALMLKGFARALLAVAGVSTVGARNYTPGAWRRVPDGIDRYDDAAMRHYLRSAFEEVDADTSCEHDAQVIWDLLAR